jgi:hypothetical protein
LRCQAKRGVDKATDHEAGDRSGESGKEDQFELSNPSESPELLLHAEREVDRELNRQGKDRKSNDGL